MRIPNQHQRISTDSLVDHLRLKSHTCHPDAFILIHDEMKGLYSISYCFKLASGQLNQDQCIRNGTFEKNIF